MTSIKKNIFASYLSQVYTTLIGIFVLPIYIKYMGAEEYGLIGFFTMLQAWFNILDMGFTSAIARETAKLKGGATNALLYRQLFRSLQIIFLTIALLGGGSIFLLSDLISEKWLKTTTIPLEQVNFSIQLMAICAALRWASGLYKGCILGAEQVIWLSGLSILIATLRFVIIFPILIFIGNSPVVFFTYQLLVALLEMSVLVLKNYQTLPPIKSHQEIKWNAASLLNPIKPILRLSLTIAFTSTMWVAITQIDKLILSKLLSLSDYGYFTLATLAASGILLISSPISNTTLPRMMRLQAEGNEFEFINLYKKLTRITCIITAPSCFILALFPSQILYIWTGDTEIATKTALILACYAIGNFFVSLMTLPYNLQLSKGNLNNHLTGNIIFITFWIPLLIWSTTSHGSTGAAYTWLILNTLYFFAWIPVVHKNQLTSSHAMWLVNDIAFTTIPALILLIITSKTIAFTESRVWNLIIIIAILLTATVITLLSEKIRQLIIKKKQNE